jgi:hypothetical protein
MTDEERIDEIISDLRKFHLVNRDIDWLRELARLGLPRKPPEGSVPVRIPVGYDAMGNVSWKGYVRGTGEKYSDVTAWFDEVHGRDRDAVAIVTAWLPPVVQPEVEGTVEG